MCKGVKKYYYKQDKSIETNQASECNFNIFLFLNDKFICICFIIVYQSKKNDSKIIYEIFIYYVY